MKKTAPIRRIWKFAVGFWLHYIDAAPDQKGHFGMANLVGFATRKHNTEWIKRLLMQTILKLRNAHSTNLIEEHDRNPRALKPPGGGRTVLGWRSASRVP